MALLGDKNIKARRCGAVAMGSFVRASKTAALGWCDGRPSPSVVLSCPRSGDEVLAIARRHAARALRARALRDSHRDPQW